MARHSSLRLDGREGSAGDGIAMSRRRLLMMGDDEAGFARHLSFNEELATPPCGDGCEAISPAKCREPHI